MKVLNKLRCLFHSCRYTVLRYDSEGRAVQYCSQCGRLMGYGTIYPPTPTPVPPPPHKQSYIVEERELLRESTKRLNGQARPC